MINLAVIGCGAVSENLHVPAILERDDVRLAAVVDRNKARARLIAEKSGAVPYLTVEEALPDFDAAIIALPHHLHSSVTVDLLRKKKHVLVEKPMATTVAECELMIAESRQNKVLLTVGQMRRFCPAIFAAKTLLDQRALGDIKEFHILEGNIYNWPVASNFFFQKKASGGGVLMDTGAHTFDTILWLLGDFKKIRYRDDSRGGVEADCQIMLETMSGAKGYVELSRTRNLPAVLTIVGEKGKMAVSYKENTLILELGNRKLSVADINLDLSKNNKLSIWEAMIRYQLDDWILALSGKRCSLVTGDEGIKVIKFIEKCYASKEGWKFDW